MIKEAPEKVYRTTTYLNSERGNTVWKSEPVRGAENIEYVRKDAFIEKACRFIKEHHHEFSFWNTEEYELGFTTQKFIEDFKKYMEE